MACAGALLETSRFSSSVGPSDKAQVRGSRYRWHAWLGGILGAFLLSAATQASPLPISETLPASTLDTTQVTQVLEDGIYFYGEALQPNAIGSTYLVFEAKDSQIIGAIFMPNSSFDCFHGHISGNELALGITNSYTQETYEHAIALITEADPVAAIGTVPSALQLDGLFELGAARDAELAFLSTCQADLSPSGESNL
ncbi:MAG: hypothetical protein F6K42_05325 [Leptolyngbya sp. SIO1D8]|nr:hypothetical protein [Leptolyngbya sp. SIO1D8]